LKNRQSTYGEALLFCHWPDRQSPIRSISAKPVLVWRLLKRFGMTPAELRQRVAIFAAGVAKFARPLLGRPETYDAARQLIRSSASAADNHRAAGRARSHAEFTARIGVALDEADEAKSWLEYLQNSGCVSADRIRPLPITRLPDYPITRFQIVDYRLPITDYRDCQLSVPDSRSPVADCRLTGLPDTADTSASTWTP
jgi:four helix bundle protein